MDNDSESRLSQANYLYQKTCLIIPIGCIWTLMVIIGNYHFKFTVVFFVLFFFYIESNHHLFISPNELFVFHFLRPVSLTVKYLKNISA